MTPDLCLLTPDLCSLTRDRDPLIRDLEFGDPWFFLPGRFAPRLFTPGLFRPGRFAPGLFVLDPDVSKLNRTFRTFWSQVCWTMGFNLNIKTFQLYLDDVIMRVKVSSISKVKKLYCSHSNENSYMDIEKSTFGYLKFWTLDIQKLIFQYPKLDFWISINQVVFLMSIIWWNIGHCDLHLLWGQSLPRDTHYSKVGHSSTKQSSRYEAKSLDHEM